MSGDDNRDIAAVGATYRTATSKLFHHVHISRANYFTLGERKCHDRVDR
jgi:hypothetical protein